MSWLLLFFPIAIGLEIFAPERHLLLFTASSLAILPLAGWMGKATEQLADRMGEGVGGLLNATFGNAAELIIGLAALHAGLPDVVKASIAGSIVGNVLLVLGAAMLAGGLGRSEQHFNAAGARSQATMLVLAAITLVLPAAFQVAAGTTAEGLSRLSVSISVVLLLVYLLYLVFALVTHSKLFAGPGQAGEEKTQVSVAQAAAVLGGATAGIVWMSELLVAAIRHPRKRRGTRNGYKCRLEGPYGFVAFNRNWLQRSDCAFCCSYSGTSKPFYWSSHHGFSLSRWARYDGSALCADHGSGCGRWTIRLA